MGDFYIESEQIPEPREVYDAGRLIGKLPEKIDVASDGIPPGQDFEGSRRCSQCGFLYKYSEIREFRGRYYGIPCGDYKDIASILRREMAERQRSRIREQHRHK